MYKRSLGFLLSLLVIAAAVEGYYLVRTLQKNKVESEKQAMYGKEVAGLKASIGAYEEKLSELKAQLYEKEARVEESALASAVVEKTRKATVTLHTTVPMSAYGGQGRWSGSGVIVDKGKGLIVTNAHIVSRESISTYEAILYNGRAVEATLLYYDPWVDVAVLQVEADKVATAEEVRLSEEEPVGNEPIFILGNNEGKSHSVHTGRISRLKGIDKVTFHSRYFYLSHGSLSYSLNSTGGSSGSGVFNHRGEILALHYAGSQTYGCGVSLGYLKHILGCIQENTTPARRHVGMNTALLPLADIIKYADIAQEEEDMLKRDLPAQTQHLLVVEYILKGSPAEEVLQAGDIIYKVAGQVIGSDLCKLDLLMSKASGEAITFTFFRQGKKMEAKIRLYDLHAHKITKMVAFGGTIFFETNDEWSHLLNVPAGTLTFHQIAKGSSLSTSKYFPQQRFYGQVNAVDGIEVTDLEDLIRLIPGLIAKGHFTMHYTDLEKRGGVTLINYSRLDPPPITYSYNPGTRHWDPQRITL